MASTTELTDVSMAAPAGPDELAAMIVAESGTILSALRALDRGRQGIAFVCDESGRVLGTMTDGDVRRALLRGARPEDCCLAAIMQRDFTSVTPEASRAEVLDLLRARLISQVPVLDAAGRLVGLHTVREMLGPTVRPNWAVILAGGKGTRLRPLTENTPKPMITVAGRPILERLILHLVGAGFRRVFISVNYLAEVIERHFEDGSRFGCRIEYLRETQELGTGGPLTLLPERPEHPLVVMNGDLVTQCDLGALLDFNAQGAYAATLGVRPYSVDVPFGVADVDGDRLVGMREKPSLRMLVNAGIYAISPPALDLIPRGEEFPITELFSRALGRGLPVGAHLIEDEWLDVGRPDELKRARGHA
jgi:dTDP-glucose pyrophosphorylase